MSTALIVREGDALQIAQEAYALRDEAMADALLIPQVTSAEENSNAIAALKKLKSFIDRVEDQRTVMKRPLLEACRLLDGACKGFVGIEGIRDDKPKGVYLALVEKVEAFQLAERRRVEEERERQAAELRRIEDGKRAAIRQAAQEEAAEKARLLAAEAAAKNEAERKRIREESANVKADCERKMDAIVEQATIERAQVEQQTFAPNRAVGQSVKPDWDIVVNDAYRLAAFHPQCVTVTPKLAEIKALLALGKDVQGVKATPKVTVGIRTPPQRKAIDV